MNAHDEYMRIALDLARKAEGLTSPNPAVGAVIVRNGRIVGRGYHKKCGAPHAEVIALRQAGSKAKGAILYVTLEPCDHFGRTPPCTAAIIEHGIKKVVAAMRDPNPINNGKGFRKLRKAGVECTVGVLEQEARDLNSPYIKFISTRMPFVTLKMAESLDGKIATRTGDSKWITSEDARHYVRGLRGRVDAVMTGSNTAAKDDPTLLSGASSGKEPIRIIVDSHVKTPLKAKIFSTTAVSPVIIATTKNMPERKTRLYKAKGVNFLRAKAKGGRVDLKDLFRILGVLNITHVLVEGGGELAASLIEERLADRFLFFIAPKIVGGRDAVTAVEGLGVGKMSKAVMLRDIKIKRFEEDVLIEARAR
ncbi:MAG: bifunctional diaminohydroxyphosphoribosylaminopyrimidine deaminase/5-amino-6-(5-phosphoribosylamino)uracil reductase RibD [Candidatus Omnitrophota bacterium]|nr:bifunctional diaminohydroxyphosphoribosylaminopyrimidine deaminase/5-amino-6-(5-phosphoribosylamino)uracil reductase RibD [Candidatus Omnitrophota bacterium]